MSLSLDKVLGILRFGEIEAWLAVFDGGRKEEPVCIRDRISVTDVATAAQCKCAWAGLCVPRHQDGALCCPHVSIMKAQLSLNQL